MPTKESGIIDRLISRSDPGDALADYYARWHPESRIVTQHEPAQGVLVEAESRYGPVAVLRSRSARALSGLVSELSLGKRYIITTWDMSEALENLVEVSDPERNRVFWRAKKVVSWAGTTLGNLHCEDDEVRVSVDGNTASRCFKLWSSPKFAELGVVTEQEYRGRGLASRVVNEMSRLLLNQGITPIYIATVQNLSSLRVAARLGFAPCCDDEFAGYVSIPESLRQ